MWRYRRAAGPQGDSVGVCPRFLPEGGCAPATGNTSRGQYPLWVKRAAGVWLVSSTWPWQDQEYGERAL